MSLTGEEIAPSKSKELANSDLVRVGKFAGNLGCFFSLIGIKHLVWRLRMTTKRVPESSLIKIKTNNIKDLKKLWKE
jgi:hypothetical protein